jgi:trimethylamine---corrinoid protein Co-methyltransferase
MRPTVRFLTEDLIERILAEARDILCRLGMEVYDEEMLTVLSDNGAAVDGPSHLKFSNDLIDKALKTVPSSFKLFDVNGRETHDFSEYTVYYTPASSALKLLDYETGKMREPVTADYIRYVKVVSRLNYIQSQSTAFIPAEVEEKLSDSYRLYLNLMYGTKPVITGTFSEKGFPVMKELQLAVRGTEAALKEKPLTLFSCCSTTPLKWGERSIRDIVDCGRAGIPVELISMPLTGFTGPITLVGSLVGHTVENLAGIVISQLSHPGAPLLYGGAPAAFDMRSGTTSLGAIETQMMDCAYNEIGKYLGLPTQAYIALSDAKALDAQAGLETSMGAVLASLSGINSISGPGMLDFVNCFSLEKLVLDNEICGMTQRLLKGIEPKEDFPTLPHYRELLENQYLLSSKHTLKYFKEEHFIPGKTIDRATHPRWEEAGSKTLGERARSEIEKYIDAYTPNGLSPETKQNMTEIINAEAHRCGMEKLPECPEV